MKESSREFEKGSRGLYFAGKCRPKCILGVEFSYSCRGIFSFCGIIVILPGQPVPCLSSRTSSLKDLSFAIIPTNQQVYI